MKTIAILTRRADADAELCAGPRAPAERAPEEQGRTRGLRGLIRRRRVHRDRVLLEHRHREAAVMIGPGWLRLAGGRMSYLRAARGA
jgi:hypothetical protein